MRQVTARISGRVQGVFYRASAQKEALSLGLTGWVRNLASGDVELLAEGGEEALNALLDWCRRGPSQARVDDVTVTWAEATADFTSFEIRG